MSHSARFKLASVLVRPAVLAGLLLPSCYGNLPGEDPIGAGGGSPASGTLHSKETSEALRKPEFELVFEPVPPALAEQAAKIPSVPLDDEGDDAPTLPSTRAALQASSLGSRASERFWGGPDAELFRPDKGRGPLLDWSYAGYHGGLDPIPHRRAIKELEVANPGAGKDITQAIKSAVEKAAAVSDPTKRVVLLPAGRFLLSDRILLSTGVVLRGAGRDKTTLYVSGQLRDKCGARGCYNQDSPYANDHGYITAGEDFALGGDELATVVGAHQRTKRVLRVSSTAKLREGDWIQVRAGGSSLVGPAFGGRISPPPADTTVTLSFPTRIAKVEGDSITIERRLPIDLPSESSPKILTLPRKTEEVGVEELTIEFDPSNPYSEHWDCDGRNGIYFHGVSNSWIRNVKILNAELGIILRPSLMVTVEDVLLKSARPGYKEGKRLIRGHWGIYMSLGGGDNLIQRFDIDQGWNHDIGSEKGARGNVVSEGTGHGELEVEHHGGVIYDSLWTDVDLGEGTRNLTLSGGGPYRGAGWITFWNVHSNQPLSIPTGTCNTKCGPGKKFPDGVARIKIDFVDTTFVATPVSTTQEQADAIMEYWRTFKRDWSEEINWKANPRISIDNIPPGDVYPQNLYRAQVARRLARVWSLPVKSSKGEQVAELTHDTSVPGGRGLVLGLGLTSSVKSVMVTLDGKQLSLGSDGSVKLPDLEKKEHELVVRCLSDANGAGYGYPGATFTRRFTVR